MATNPDLVLLFVSGHQGLFDNLPSESYLHETIGPVLRLDLESLGYTTEIAYFVDHPTATNAGGYADLVATMQWTRDNWIVGQTRPTEVVLVSHSHGGVWATAAVQAVPGLPIAMHVALDHSSYGWGLVGHDLHDAVIGGDPRDRFDLGVVGGCGAGPAGDLSTIYDLEDVVFPNVVQALEVRSGDTPLGGEAYDEKWNARTNGTFTGMSCYYSGTSHSEVHSPLDTTYPIVFDSVLGALSAP